MFINYAGVNTTIAVKDREFLSPDQWQALLDAKDDQTVANLLQDTPYAMSSQALSQPDQIEAVLMKGLKAAYDTMFEAAPQSQVVELFSAKYLYHNLKVLMKAKATDRNLDKLLIPIGRFSLDSLRHLVDTLESPTAYPSLVEEVRRTWQEYQAYQIADAIDVGFDGAYFAHLRMLEDKINNPQLKPLVDGMIDFYNVIAIQRAKELGKSRSFMYTMMTSRGSLDKADLIQLVEENRLDSWYQALNPTYLGRAFDQSIALMKEGQIKASHLEQLYDSYLHQLLHEHRLDTDGPFQVLRYLHGKEMEVRNLRLVLTGRANGIAQEKIKERMGTIYGKGL